MNHINEPYNVSSLTRLSVHQLTEPSVTLLAKESDQLTEPKWINQSKSSTTFFEYVWTQ